MTGRRPPTELAVLVGVLFALVVARFERLLRELVAVHLVEVPAHSRASCSTLSLSPDIPPTPVSEFRPAFRAYPFPGAVSRLCRPRRGTRRVGQTPVLRRIVWWLVSAALVCSGGYIGWTDAQPSGGLFTHVEAGWASLLGAVLVFGCRRWLRRARFSEKVTALPDGRIQLGGSIAIAAMLASYGYISQIDCFDPGDVCELAGCSIAVGTLSGLGCVVVGLTVDVALGERATSRDE